ncbi:VCBS repeat-containing protein [Rhodocaloribacter litoris]|uniref:FG-GAP repeat domain-containing protein n=1 Tax=Rhodocaloribacter litoris TaxID=2558931 RepID=UPI001420B2F0|nr:VCBS repeat-containing protein [Rhodocaloribacter litoris]QXD16513.1 VCBS repeat-containing protein [Rhodocaloribacter litoris]
MIPFRPFPSRLVPAALGIVAALALLATAPGHRAAPPRPWLIPYPVKAVSLGSLDWGDLDGDGDLDLLLTGQTVFGTGATATLGATTRVYRTDDSTFNIQRGEAIFTVSTKVLRDVNLNNTLVPPVRQGSARWCDYDQDGKLDILLTGISERITASGKENIPIAHLYRNVDGRFGTQVQILEPGVYDGEATCADVDGDGDPDLLLSGATRLEPPLEPVTLLFRNEGGAFTRIETGLPGLRHSAAAWGDLDGDGDLDLALSGARANGQFMAAVYRNDAGTFTRLPADLPPVAFGSLEWGDYDNDGDPDLLLSGGMLDPELLRGVTRVYRNDGPGLLTDIQAGLKGWLAGKARWGDIDNDGDLDLLAIGLDRALGIPALHLFENTGNRFTEAEILRGFSGLAFGDARLADYNGDGDLDLLLTGRQSSDMDLTLRFFMNRLIPECTDPAWVPTGEALTCL